MLHEMKYMRKGNLGFCYILYYLQKKSQKFKGHEHLKIFHLWLFSHKTKFKMLILNCGHRRGKRQIKRIKKEDTNKREWETP